MISYLINSHDKLLKALAEHIIIVSITMFIAIIIAGVVVLLIRRSRRLPSIVISALSVLYSIPSLAMFAMLIPFCGLGRTTAIIVLVIYAQYILVRNFNLGLDEVDGSILEAAKGMGMNDSQILRRIQLPLAAGSMIAGIKLAATTTIGIATIASSINAGGLGVILFDGLRTLSLIKMLWGTILTALMCVLVNICLGLLEKRFYRVK